ncbi:serine hydrolase domain-containing protein [Hyphomonas sp.]|uniref:serine hydrolase domain-containing protein n=1 Tax=Hyphomonas sp. TaxID=87 RepID=UPI0035299FFD
MTKSPLAKAAFPLALTLFLASCGVETPASPGSSNDTANLEIPARGKPPASESFYEPVMQRLDEDMQNYVQTGKVANLAYALIKDGEWVRTGYFGTRTLGGSDPLDEHTIYRVDSLTKVVTAVSLLMLMEEGKFSLDDPITRFLPELENLKVTRSFEAGGGGGLRPANRAPTMRELLTHTAGFAYGGGRTNYANQVFLQRDVDDAPTGDEYVKRIAEVPLMYQPGTAWSDSAASDLQGIIIERISGERLGAFMKRRIFDPLGMVDTGFSVTEAQRWRLADLTAWAPGQPLTPVEGPHQAMDADQIPRDSGGHGLVSTISDYEIFAKMLLQEGTFEGQTLLSPESVRLLRTSATEFTHPETGFPIHEPFRGTGFGYGVAVVKNTIRSGLGAPEGTYFWDGGTGTWFWIDPYHDIIFIGMSQNLSPYPVMPRKTAMTDVYHALFTDYFPSNPVVEGDTFE